MHPDLPYVVSILGDVAAAAVFENATQTIQSAVYRFDPNWVTVQHDTGRR